VINGYRVAAIVVLHFGADYLRYAMRSVADVVDAYIFMYSPAPSHGHDSTLACPETQQHLAAVALETLKELNRPGEWHTGHWNSEGAQFQEGISHTDAEIIVKLDCDEAWSPGLLASAITQGLERGKHEMRVALWHYWRSFHRAFTHDPAAPGRIYFRMFPRTEGSESTYNKPDDCPDDFTIHHFGYAMSAELTNYKMSIHGHKSQFKMPWQQWVNEVFLPNRQTDVHPCGSEYWMQTEDVTPPEFLRDHPFAALDVIP
jgi:hypothetical protein